MNQSEFYQLPEVIKQINIQKANKFGSNEHKAAYIEIYLIAEKHGVSKHFDSFDKRMTDYDENN